MDFIIYIADENDYIRFGIIYMILLTDDLLDRKI